MNFGELFSQSWNEYKLNFKVIFKLFLCFVILPGIILLIFSLCAGSSLGLLGLSKDANTNIFAEHPVYTISYFILSLLVGFISYLAYVSVACGSLKGKKFRFSEALQEGKKNYWRAIGFTIVIGIFLALLFILLIIPGIIFVVYWAFAYFVFLGEKKGIIDSLKISYKMVKGKWWMTLGYGILIMLIILAISIVIAIPTFISGLIYGLSAVSGASVSTGTVVMVSIVGFVFGMLGKLITTPLLTLFMKNFYLSMKHK